MTTSRDNTTTDAGDLLELEEFIEEHEPVVMRGGAAAPEPRPEVSIDFDVDVSFEDEEEYEPEQGLSLGSLSQGHLPTASQYEDSPEEEEEGDDIFFLEPEDELEEEVELRRVAQAELVDPVPEEEEFELFEVVEDGFEELSDADVMEAHSSPPVSMPPPPPSLHSPSQMPHEGSLHSHSGTFSQESSRPRTLGRMDLKSTSAHKAVELKRRNVELKRKTQELEGETLALEFQISQLRESGELVEQELASTQRLLAEAQAEREIQQGQHQQALEKLQLRNRELEQRLSAQEEAQPTAQRESQVQLFRIQTLEQALEQARERSEGYHQEVAQLKGEVSALRAQAERDQRHRAHAEERAGRLEAIRREQDARLSEMEVAAARSTKEISQLEEVLRQTQDAQRQLLEAKQRDRELMDTLERRLEEAQAQVEALAGELDQEQHSAQQLQGTLEEALAQQQEREQELTQARQEQAQAQQQLQAALQSQEEAQSALEEQQAQAQQLQQERAQAQQERAQAQQALAQVQRALAQAQQATEQAQREAQQAQREAQQAMADLQAADAQRGELEQELEHAQESVARAAERMMELESQQRQRLEASQEQSQEQRQEAERLQQEVAALQQQARDQEQSALLDQEQLQQLQQALAQAQQGQVQQAQQAQQERRELEEALLAMQAQLEALKAERTDLMQEVFFERSQGEQLRAELTQRVRENELLQARHADAFEDDPGSLDLEIDAEEMLEMVLSGEEPPRQSSDLQRLQAEHQELAQAFESLQQSHMERSQQLMGALADGERMRANLVRIAQQLSAARGESEAFEQERQRLIFTIETLQQQVALLQDVEESPAMPPAATTREVMHAAEPSFHDKPAVEEPEVPSYEDVRSPGAPVRDEAASKARTPLPLRGLATNTLHGTPAMASTPAFGVHNPLQSPSEDFSLEMEHELSDDLSLVLPDELSLAQEEDMMHPPQGEEEVNYYSDANFFTEQEDADEDVLLLDEASQLEDMDLGPEDFAQDTADFFGQDAFPGEAFADQGFGEQGFGEQGFGDQGFGEQGFEDQGFGEQGFGEHDFEEAPAYPAPQQARAFGEVDLQDEGLEEADFFEEERAPAAPDFLEPGDDPLQALQARGLMSVCPVPDFAQMGGLDHKAGFFIGIADGATTVEDLLDLSGMPVDEAATLVMELIDRGALRIGA